MIIIIQIGVIAIVMYAIWALLAAASDLVLRNDVMWKLWAYYRYVAAVVVVGFAIIVRPYLFGA